MDYSAKRRMLVAFRPSASCSSALLSGSRADFSHDAKGLLSCFVAAIWEGIAGVAGGHLEGGTAGEVWEGSAGELGGGLCRGSLQGIADNLTQLQAMPWVSF